MEAVEKHPGWWKEGEGQAGREGTPPHASVKLMQGAPRAHGPQLPHHCAPTLLPLPRAERVLPTLCTCSLQTPRAHSLPAPALVQRHLPVGPRHPAHPDCYSLGHCSRRTFLTDLWLSQFSFHV